MAQFTQKAILSTFQDMLEEMPFDKITVSAIVKRCEISSNTFYYHFRDIYDLLDSWLITTFQMFIDRPEFSWRDAAKEFLHVCQDHKKIVYHLSNSLSRERMEQYVFSQSNDYFVRFIIDVAGDKKLPDDQVSQLAEFCRYSTTGFFLRFLWNQMNDDIDTSVDRLADMFHRSCIVNPEELVDACHLGDIVRFPFLFLFEQKKVDRIILRPCKFERLHDLEAILSESRIPTF